MRKSVGASLAIAITWTIVAGAPAAGHASIDVEKFTQVIPRTPGGDLCDTFGKPARLTMTYTGDGPDATSHAQDSGKVVVTGDPMDADPVRIRASNRSNPSDTGARVWFEGVVSLGDDLVLDAANGGESRLSSDTFVHIFDAATGQLLQTVKFHTSCSQPLRLGDQFGALRLVGFTDEHGGSASIAPPPTGFGEDADEPTGPTAVVGDGIVWTYVVTNPTDTPLSGVGVTDDNGTPDDPSDDFAPPAALDGAWNVGDENMNGLLEQGEVWLFQATSTAVLGQYANRATASGNPVPQGPRQFDSDPSHYLGVFPEGNLCDTFGKPARLTMTYTGDGPDATSHAQDSGKVVVTGDPMDADPVRIRASNRSNPSDTGARVWFEGVVSLGDDLVLDAANGGESRLSSDTFVHIFDAATGQLLQTVKFHTSCSQPLRLGDQFGALRLVGFTDEKGGSAP